MYKFILSLFCIALSLKVFAQPTGSGVTQNDLQLNTITTAVPFMAITPDSRAGGMGDAGTALSADANSVYWNTSLLNSVVPEIGMISTQIQLVETKEYCNKFLNNFVRYIIKCDTQGMDALILSRIPDWVWKNCESAIIEVWAHDEISKKDVEALLSMCQEFEYASWQPNNRKGEIGLSEVSEFWLSKSGASRNLFLSRNF